MDEVPQYRSAIEFARNCLVVACHRRSDHGGLPVAPIGTAWWRIANAANGNFHYEVGYLELVDSVAKIRGALPNVAHPGRHTPCAHHSRSRAQERCLVFSWKILLFACHEQFRPSPPTAIPAAFRYCLQVARASRDLAALSTSLLPEGPSRWSAGFAQQKWRMEAKRRSNA